jgi:hypothetical protein
MGSAESFVTLMGDHQSVRYCQNFKNAVLVGSQRLAGIVQFPNHNYLTMGCNKDRHCGMNKHFCPLSTMTRGCIRIILLKNIVQHYNAF